MPGKKSVKVLSPYEMPEGSKIGALWTSIRGPPDKRLNVSSSLKDFKLQMAGPALVLGNNEPLVLTLGGDENVTVGGPDIPYVTDFAASLTGGQVKTRLQKWISRKTMSYDDTMQVAEALATEFVNFVRTAPKYDAMPNKKPVITRAKLIAKMAQDLIKEQQESEDEGEDVASGSEESDELDADSPTDSKSDAEEEEDDAETLDESEKEDGDTDEELEARAGSSGFIPVSKPSKAGNSGKISTKTTLLTATYRTREGREHNPTAVVGVGPGKLRFETELNEDGSLKRKTSSKNQNATDNTMYFYTGSLSEENSSEVPLKTGIRLTDSSHLQRMCTEIVVRAFSQQIFTHKTLRNNDKRGAVKASIIKWLTKEVDEGVTQVLDQIYDEAKGLISNEKEESREVKRKLDGKQALLQAAKKTKKTV